MIYILLADGFEEVEGITQIDFLRRASLEIKALGVGKKKIVGGHSIEIDCDGEISEANEDFDMLILPGGLRGVENMEKSEKAMKLIKKAYEKNSYIAAICAAPTILAKLGILKGKKAVCYPSMKNILTENGVEYIDKPFVRDGFFITGKGPGASEEFALELISVLKASKTAEKIRNDACCR